MGLLDPKPQTQAGLDAAVTAKINTPGSATATALSATFLPKEVNPAAPTDITTLMRLNPNEAGVAPFDIVSKQFANGGGKPYNVGTWIGYNARTYLQNGTSEIGKLTWNLGMESGYHNPDDLTYGPEFYLNYGSPDGVAVGVAQLRPMYFRLIEGDTNSITDKGVHVLFDIGQNAAKGVFSVGAGNAASGNLPLLHITKGELRLGSTAVVADGGSFAVRPAAAGNVAASFIIDSKGTGAAVAAFRVGGAAAGGWVATDVNTIYLSDKADNPVLVSNYGATVAARQINIRGAATVDGVIKAGSGSPITVADTGNLGAVPTVSGNAVRGTISMGTGAAPAAGDAVAITIPAGVYTTAPTVVASASNFTTSGRAVYAYAVSATEIRIGLGLAPAASQVAGTYKVNYQIIG